MAAAHAQGRLDISLPVVRAVAPNFVLAALALASGGWDVIARDWRVALNALQIIAEQGPGMAAAEAQRREDAAFAESMRALGG